MSSGEGDAIDRAPASGSQPPRRRDREVLEAATKVFHQRGYADATVQDVADELGILKGSLYHYISSKEDLLFRLLEETHEHVEDVLARVAAREGLDPLERLRLYVRDQVEYMVANLPRIAVYYHDIEQLSPARLKALVARRRTHENWVRDRIREAQERGEVDGSLDAALLMRCMFGTMIWVYRWYRPGGPSRREAVVDHVTRVSIAGIVAAGGAPPA